MLAIVTFFRKSKLNRYEKLTREVICSRVSHLSLDLDYYFFNLSWKTLSLSYATRWQIWENYVNLLCLELCMAMIWKLSLSGLEVYVMYTIIFIHSFCCIHHPSKTIRCFREGIWALEIHAHHVLCAGSWENSNDRARSHCHQYCEQSLRKNVGWGWLTCFIIHFSWFSWCIIFY